MPSLRTRHGISRQSKPRLKPAHHFVEVVEVEGLGNLHGAMYGCRVNRKERRAIEATGGTIESAPHYGVTGAVSYGPPGSPSTITLGPLMSVEPDRTFAADCGFARLRLNTPELHFGQLDPYQERSLLRAVIVRFDRRRFVERVKASESFRNNLEALLSPSRTAGELSALFESARFPAKPAVVTIDAEFEVSSYSGGRASMVFLTASQAVIAAALKAQAREVHFDPTLEVTMTSALLADVLLSWKNLAETLR